MKVFHLIAAISKARRIAQTPVPPPCRHGNVYYPSPSIASIVKSSQVTMWEVKRLSPFAFRVCQKLGWF
jgi:hypothetical protein